MKYTPLSTNPRSEDCYLVLRNANGTSLTRVQRRGYHHGLRKYHLLRGTDQSCLRFAIHMDFHALG